MHILFLPIYLGETLFPLLDISVENFFPRWGGGGGCTCPQCTCTQCTPPPPAYAPGIPEGSETAFLYVYLPLISGHLKKTFVIFFFHAPVEIKYDTRSHSKRQHLLCFILEYHLPRKIVSVFKSTESREPHNASNFSHMHFDFHQVHI